MDDAPTITPAPPEPEDGLDAVDDEAVEYKTDHLEERWKLHDHYVHMSYLSRCGVKSGIPSGLILAAILVVGAGMGFLGMALMGAVGVIANLRGMRSSYKAMQFEDNKAATAFTIDWPEDEPEPTPLVATGTVFEYVDPASGWESLDLIRDHFPEVAADMPPGAKNELKLREKAGDPETVKIMYGALSRSLQLMLEASPDECFPIGNQLHPLLEERLDLFASKLGLGTVAGCIFDVPLPRADGGTVVARYEFPGDGTMDLHLIPLEALTASSLQAQMEAMGVPAADPLAYNTAAAVWAAVDRLATTFPEVSAGLAQVAERVTEMRSMPEGEDAYDASMQLLNGCITEVVARSTAETVDARLGTAATLLAKGAVDGSTLTMPLAGAVVRITFREKAAHGFEATVFTPEGVMHSEETGEPAGPAQTTEVATAPAPAPATPAGGITGLPIGPAKGSGRTL